MSKEIEKRIASLMQHLTVEEKVGQLFVMGYAGQDTEYACNLVRQLHVGGFYLTQDNASTPEAAFALNSTLNYEAHLRACDAPLLLAVDQEGAWGVLVEHTTTGPGNLALGVANQPELTGQMHSILAREMRSLGFNTILGPCSDVNSNPSNPIIGVRAFGETPAGVAPHVAAAVTGLRSGGVISAAKHFPGHGDTGEDSHRLLPSVNKTLTELQQSDLIPFQAAIDAGVNLIMTSHILYPFIDSDNPATLSPIILQDVLRKQMGFKGLIISDSMNMWSMRKNYAPAEAAIKALQAGVDLIMLSEEHYENQTGNYQLKQRETIEGVIAAVKSGVIAQTLVDATLARVLTFKYTNEALVDVPALDLAQLQSDSHQLIAGRAATAAVQLVRNTAGQWPIKSPSFTLAGVSNPHLHQLVVNTRGIGPNEPEAAYTVFTRELQRANCPFEQITYSDLPSLFDSSSSYDGPLPLVLITEDYPLPGLDYDAGQQALLVQQALAKFGDQVIVIGLRSDYELAGFPRLSTYLCAYSSRACSAKAAATRLVADQLCS